MNNIERLFAERDDPAGFVDGYLTYLSEILGKIDRAEVAEFIETLRTARGNGATVFFMGNGGSAATASHFQNDLTRWRDSPMRVISLTDNVAVLTAIGNDYGYDNIFRMQLENLLRPKDVVVAISASGNSPNIIQAVEYAIEQDAIVVGLTGFDGGQLSQLAHVNVHAPTMKGEYGPAEDVHLIIDHVVMSYLWEWGAAELRRTTGYIEPSDPRARA